MTNPASEAFHPAEFVAKVERLFERGLIDLQARDMLQSGLLNTRPTPSTGPLDRTAVETVLAATFLPMCRGFGHGDMPRAIAEEFAAKAADALALSTVNRAAAVGEATQADRDRAADLVSSASLSGWFGVPTVDIIRGGRYDDHPFVEAFRDHRLSTLSAPTAGAEGRGTTEWTDQQAIDLFVSCIDENDHGYGKETRQFIRAIKRAAPAKPTEQAGDAEAISYGDMSIGGLLEKLTDNQRRELIELASDRLPYGGKFHLSLSATEEIDLKTRGLVGWSIPPGAMAPCCRLTELGSRLAAALAKSEGAGA